ncbi:MAG: phosphoadenosine phosphosulfate reductase family protein [Marinilabiliaceae bacterium]|nr:phosphoadenosine phosphosulfate reductase family protein [Marinilabiliaceae bacterium]
MLHAKRVISEVAQKTDRILLFHSGSGKDSIALLDLCAPYFKEIVCVYMYVVKDLEHINRYIQWSQNNYKNVKFIQVPHYSLSSYVKHGVLGCKKNEKQPYVTLSQIGDICRKRLGIDWLFLGFKQTDSLNRRCMLRTYEEEAICEKTKKVYPLSKYRNIDILHYIEEQNLMRPEHYGKGQSAGTAITDVDYLKWLKENFPQDLKKVLAVFPMAEHILFQYEKQREHEKLENVRDEND